MSTCDWLPVDCCFNELALWQSNSACCAKRFSALACHQNVTCSCHEIAEHLLIWCKNRNHSLTLKTIFWECITQRWKCMLMKKDWIPFTVHDYHHFQAVWTKFDTFHFKIFCSRKRKSTDQRNTFISAIYINQSFTDWPYEPLNFKRSCTFELNPPFRTKWNYDHKKWI